MRNILALVSCFAASACSTVPSEHSSPPSGAQSSVGCRLPEVTASLKAAHEALAAAKAKHASERSEESERALLYAEADRAAASADFNYIKDHECR